MTAENSPLNPPSAEYLADNNAFYREFWQTNPLYRTPYPNVEEADRLAALFRMLALLFERGDVDRPRARILDLGSGRGWLTKALSVFGACEGCEPTPEAVAMARRLYPELVFHVATLEQLLSSPAFDAYDIIVSSEVLEHVPRNSKADFVQQIYRGLASPGHCLLTTPRAELWDRCGDSSSQLIEDWVTENEVLQFFTEAGFHPVAHDRAHPTHSSVFHRIAHRIDRLLAPTELRMSSPFRRALDYRSCLYQVWCFRRR